MKKLNEKIFPIFMTLVMVAAIFIVAPLNAEPNDNSILSYDYDFEQPNYEMFTIADTEFTYLKIDGCKNSGFTGEPKIPVKPLRFLLPQGTAVDKITVNTGEKQSFSMEGYPQIALGSEVFPISEMPTGPNAPEANYDTQNDYPGYFYKNAGVQFFRGYPIVHINLYPVQYHGDTHSYDFYPEINVQIETKETEINPLYRGLQKDLDIVSPQVDNFEANIVDTYQMRSGQDSLSTAEYIIITTSSWTDDFQPLANDRSSQGLSTMIKTVSSINNEYSGEDTEANIRLFIQDAYQNMGTEWVLLGGDQGYVPARFLYDIDGGDGSLTSDMYYQCLDGDYNYDGDSRYGEEYDGVGGGQIDLYAEVYAGRASVDNEAQIDNFIAKTLAYEDYDWGSDSNVEVADSVGEHLGFGGVSEYAKNSLLLNIDHDTDHGQDTHGIPTSNQDYTDKIFTVQGRYEEDGSWSDNDIEADLNAGLNIIDHLGHASPTSAMKWTPSEINALTNTKYAFWYTQGCHPGQFEVVDECIAESWTLSDAAGFACIMNTGYGYGMYSSTDGPDNRFSREFYDALFYPNEQISKISMANQDSTQDLMWRMDEECMYHDAYQNMLFGDPYTALIGAEDFGANFDWGPPDYPNPGDTIYFTDQSIGASSWQWNFGDGGSSNVANPTHVYSSEGVYDVKLTIYGQGKTDSVTKQVEVYNNWPPVSIPNPDFYAGNNPEVCFNAGDSWDPDGSIASYHWDFDDGSTSDQMSVCHTFLDDGIYDVTLTVTDDGGRQAVAHAEIRIDAYTPPETEVQFSGQLGNNDWYRSIVSVKFSAYDWSGVGSTHYSLDGGQWQVFDAPAKVYSDGVHTVSFYSIDIWGNEESVNNATFRMDRGNPELSVSLDGSMVGDWFTSPVEVVCEANDDVSGVDAIYYLVEGVGRDDWNVYDGSFMMDDDGCYILRVYAEDVAGNSIGKSDPHFVCVDTGAPVTELELVGDGMQGMFYKEVSIALDAVDEGSGVNTTWYRLDGGSWQVYDGSFMVSSSGDHTLEFYSEDMLGQEEVTQSVDFTISNINFELSCGHPDGGGLFLFGNRFLYLDSVYLIGGIDVEAVLTPFSDGNDPIVDSVDFIVDGEVIDSMSSAPFVCPFSGGGFGSHEFVIRAVNEGDSVEVSMDVFVIL